MCRRGNVNVKVLKKHENDVTGIKVELTRKTRISGDIIYAVVVTDTIIGIHTKILMYDGLGKALAKYKKAVA